MISQEGYVKLRVGRDHPLADPNGYAYEHLVIWCAAGRPRPQRGFLLHHKNEVTTDNRLSNLEQVTRREHAARHGRLKLDEGRVVKIREIYDAREMTQAELALQFGVPHARISKIIRGEIWQSAGGPISTKDHRTRDPHSGRIIGNAAGERR